MGSLARAPLAASVRPMSRPRRTNDLRASLTKSRRLIVKLGSRILARPGGGGRALVDQVAESVGRFLSRRRSKKAAPRGAVLVSSGAIALGVQKLGLRTRPKQMALLQAAAAAGQSRLLQSYEQAFEANGLNVAQVLLTHADLSERTRANNARNAIAALLDAGVVPIVNENDAVAVEEIRFGDNDQLASMVAPLCDADLLVLLSDVPGVLDERGQRISTLGHHDAPPVIWERSSNSVGSGGMASKITAAQNAALAGTHAVIAGVEQVDVIDQILAGEDIGTLVPARTKRLAARKHWIAVTLRPKGALILDDGAVEAVTRGHKSLLGVGVKGVRGAFRAGDAVSLENVHGTEVARGLCRVSATDAATMASLRRDEESPVFIRSNDLVVLVDP